MVRTLLLGGVAVLALAVVAAPARADDDFEDLFEEYGERLDDQYERAEKAHVKLVKHRKHSRRHGRRGHFRRHRDFGFSLHFGRGHRPHYWSRPWYYRSPYRRPFYGYGSYYGYQRPYCW